MLWMCTSLQSPRVCDYSQKDVAHLTGQRGDYEMHGTTYESQVHFVKHFHRETKTRLSTAKRIMMINQTAAMSYHTFSLHSQQDEV